jgi:3-phosphoshikimate 1-carboxyvinyltransferase
LHGNKERIEMAHLLVSRSSLSGESVIPSSKSHTMRAILFASLAEGRSHITHPLLGSDGEAMVHACRLLGAQIEKCPEGLLIKGVNGKIGAAEDVLQAGNSGLVLRLLAAVASLSSYPIVLTGDHSIRHQRPMLPLLQGLKQLGVSAISTKADGFAPIIIQGPLKPGSAAVQGEDSQPVSALLIASIFAEGPVEICVENPGEKPWIDMTLDWLKRLGIPYQTTGYTHYRMAGRGHYRGFDYTVPGDWSSAAFLIAAALVSNSALTLHHLDPEDCQGDKQVLQVVEKMGARFQVDRTAKTLQIMPGASLRSVDVDVNDFVDALPILAVLGCYAEGTMRLYNASVARQKECDRVHCIARELRKMGAAVEEKPDGLIVKHSPLKGAVVHSHHDHRMAMSLAVAALGAQGETRIEETDCVRKTFPGFADELKRLGAQCR